MDNNNEKLLAYFTSLQHRLYVIKNGKINVEAELNAHYSYQHPLKDILAGIFNADFEDAIQVIGFYKEQIEQMLLEITRLLANYTFQDSIKGVFESDFKHTTADAVKKEFEDTLRAELNYYLNELDSISNQLSERAMELGNAKFTNAGFKLKLNITSEEIAYFFNLLYESGFIVKEPVLGKKELTKQELASFISKNFNSANADNLSQKHIANNLSARNKSAEISVLRWVDKFSAIMDGTGKR